jgi:23S rRNA (guanosine2251-2'-O)-methyltransferase
MRHRRPRPHRNNSPDSPSNQPRGHPPRAVTPPQRPRIRGGDDRHGRPRPHAAQGEIIFGAEPVRELVAASPSSVRTLYIKPGAHARFTDEIAAVRAGGGNVVTAEDDTLARMAGSESRHQGVVAAVREYAYVPLERILEEKPDPLLVIDGVTDPRNLGAILRSAECAGVRAVVIARDRTTGVTPAAVKSSAGAWAHLRIARCGNVTQTLEALKAEGYWIVALAPEGDTSVYEIDASRRLAVVLGSEDRGIRELVKKTADFVARIPMYGRVASLNVSVAAAIALFELSRRRGREPVQEHDSQDQFRGAR